MVVVSIMPCLAKKFERSREEFSTDGNPDVDFSLSTRELAQLIKQANINLMHCPKVITMLLRRIDRSCCYFGAAEVLLKLLPVRHTKFSQVKP